MIAKYSLSAVTQGRRPYRKDVGFINNDIREMKT